MQTSALGVLDAFQPGRASAERSHGLQKNHNLDPKVAGIMNTWDSRWSELKGESPIERSKRESEEARMLEAERQRENLGSVEWVEPPKRRGNLKRAFAAVLGAGLGAAAVGALVVHPELAGQLKSFMYDKALEVWAGSDPLKGALVKAREFAANLKLPTS